ncbi:hypothetical protein C5B90_13085 [Haloferax sp. Atlit-12N]|uniref:hypothetical protein n=1 Tax=Haloferax sp. Atlit-12N TaxID=2077203 RepID=UPI000E2328E0|nr:hypothetical protein [Haloferax sp. Atlit-12N]RDZ64030.1 hypothetical protein C5B90_13085 [Haloferax sp. Atlit-12N]
MSDEVTDEIPEEAREEYDEANLDDLEDDELLDEYYSCVHHLGVCAAEGQIDNQQQKEAKILREKILGRMSEEYTPTY